MPGYNSFGERVGLGPQGAEVDKDTPLETKVVWSNNRGTYFLKSVNEADQTAVIYLPDVLVTHEKGHEGEKIEETVPLSEIKTL